MSGQLDAPVVYVGERKSPNHQVSIDEGDSKESRILTYRCNYFCRFAINGSIHVGLVFIDFSISKQWFRLG